MALGFGFDSIWGGSIDEQYFKDQIDSAKTAADAQSALLLAMKNTVRGLTNIGVSAGDQRTINRLIDYYGKKYNADVSYLKELWSTDKDIKSGDVDTLYKQSKNHLDSHFSNGYQPNTYDGQKLKASGEKVTVNGKEQNVWNVGSTGNQVVWIGDGNNGGKYVSLYEYHKNYAPKDTSSTDSTGTNTSTNTGTNGTGSTSGGSGGYSSTGGSSGSSKSDASLYEYYKKQLDEILNPTPIGAEKAAELYGIDYNEQNILNRKNEATNEYYDKKVAEQQSLRTNYARNNSLYYDQVMDSYVDSYANSAATASGKGTLAANALSTMLAAGQTNSDNDYGMVQNINNFEKSRTAELENNPWLARKEYTDLGAYLSQLSAKENAAAVQKYVADLDAYSDTYAANRMYQSYQADAASARYAGLAGAKLTKAGQTTSNTSDWQQMWNYYNALGGSNYASQKTNAILKDYVNSTNK